MTIEQISVFVQNRSGQLGAVTDAYIDEESFGVAALELTRGYLEDLTAGRDRVSD